MGSRKMPLWDVASGKLLRSLVVPEYSGPSKALVFSPDGKYLAATAGNWVRLLDVSQAVHVRYYYGESARSGGFFASFAFSPDGRVLVAGTEDGAVWGWEVATGRVLFTGKGPKTSIDFLAYSPDGTMLASGVQDGTVLLWDLSAQRSK